MAVVTKHKTLKESEEELEYAPELRYPVNSFYTGLEAPMRIEAEVYNCLVRGTIPKEINGTYYRCMPDPAWAPSYEDDVWINGDGCINAVRIQNGHADFKTRYVRTEKFLIERVARRSVFGKYRNRYTDDPRVKHAVHSTANTHIVFFENQLLALKEDSRPYAMDPDTLETKGYYDFNGQYGSLTHTAHPKIDPATGEMITMGYEAKGDATTDIVYYLFDKNGKKLEECWLKAPFAGMMHDMAATDKWIIFVLPPLATVPLEQLEQGHKHFAWDINKPLMFGILPRRNPKPEDVRWFHSKPIFLGHTANGFDGADGKIYLDAPISYENMFWFFPPLEPDGKKPVPFKSQFVRFCIDPNATDLYVEPKEILPLDGDMPRLDDRFLTKPYRTLFLCVQHTDLADQSMQVVGGRYNTIAKADVETGKWEFWNAGNNIGLHEVAFVPRSADAPEGDGWVLTVGNKWDTQLSNIYVLDTAILADGPVAIIELPIRLRAGIHGNWVSADLLPKGKDFCDMTGVTTEIRKQWENANVQFPTFANDTANGGSNGIL